MTKRRRAKLKTKTVTLGCCLSTARKEIDSHEKQVDLKKDEQILRKRETIKRERQKHNKTKRTKFNKDRYFGMLLINIPCFFSFLFLLVCPFLLNFFCFFRFSIFSFLFFFFSNSFLIFLVNFFFQNLLSDIIIRSQIIYCCFIIFNYVPNCYPVFFFFLLSFPLPTSRCHSFLFFYSVFLLSSSNFRLPFLRCSPTTPSLGSGLLLYCFWVFFGNNRER